MRVVNNSPGRGGSVALPPPPGLLEGKPVPFQGLPPLANDGHPYGVKKRLTTATPAGLRMSLLGRSNNRKIPEICLTRSAKDAKLVGGKQGFDLFAHRDLVLCKPASLVPQGDWPTLPAE